MKNSEKQELKKKIKRLGLFFLIVLVPMLVLSVVLYYFAGIKEQWLQILILVVVLSLLYFVFLFVCAKLDKRKEERLKDKKDPFSD